MQIDKLVEENSYYAKVVIPGGTYTGTDSDTVTFGVGSTLVTSTTLSEETVYRFVAAVFENFKSFKELDTSFETLNEPDMITKHISAPFHPGAVKYYKEKGWM